MSYLLIPIAFAVGAWFEHAFDLSGRMLVLWRQWQARRRLP